MNKTTKKIQPIDYIICSVSLLLVILILCIYFYNSFIKSNIESSIIHNKTIISNAQTIHNDVMKASDYIFRDNTVSNYLTNGIYDNDYEKSNLVMKTISNFSIGSLVEHVIINIPSQNVVYSSFEVGKTSKEILKSDFPEYEKIVENLQNGLWITSVSSYLADYTVYSYNDYKGHIISMFIPNTRLKSELFPLGYPNFYETQFSTSRNEEIVTNIGKIDDALIEYSKDLDNNTVKFKDGNLIIKNTQQPYTSVTFVRISDIIASAFETSYFFVIVALLLIGLVLILFVYFMMKQKKLTIKHNILQTYHTTVSINFLMQKLFAQNILTKYDKERLMEYFEKENIVYFVPIVISIANYSEFHKKNAEDTSVFKYGYENIISEVLSQLGNVRTVNMGRELIGVLIYSTDVIKDNDVKLKVDYYRNFIKDNFQVDLFTVIGNVSTDFQDIALQIPTLIESQNLKLVKKNNCISLSETENNDISVQYPNSIQTKIILDINSNNMQKTKETLKEFCNYITHHEYPHAKEWFLRLFLAIVENCRNESSINIKSNIKWEEFLNCDTIYEMADIIFEAIECVDEIKAEANEHSFRETVMEIIEKEFSNPDFGIQVLIDKIGFTAPYFGQKFKQEFNLSFNRYLLECRLNYSIRLLNETNYTNSKIASLCGFSSETYFITTFKKNLGQTPKEYKTKKMTEQ